MAHHRKYSCIVCLLDSKNHHSGEPAKLFWEIFNTDHSVTSTENRDKRRYQSQCPRIERWVFPMESTNVWQPRNCSCRLLKYSKVNLRIFGMLCWMSSPFSNFTLKTFWSSWTEAILWRWKTGIDDWSWACNAQPLCARDIISGKYTITFIASLLLSLAMTSLWWVSAYCS